MVTVSRMMMLSAVVLVCTTANARAGIIFLAPQSQGGNQLTPSNYTFLGSPPTAWDPGINSAQTGPGSFPSPGSATFSIMGAGFVDASGADGGNHTGSTADITALGVSGYGASNYADDINWALNTWAAVSDFTNLGQVADGGVDAGASSAVGGQLGDIRVAA